MRAETHGGAPDIEQNTSRKTVEFSGNIAPRRPNRSFHRRGTPQSTFLLLQRTPGSSLLHRRPHGATLHESPCRLHGLHCTGRSAGYTALHGRAHSAGYTGRSVEGCAILVCTAAAGPNSGGANDLGAQLPMWSKSHRHRP